jgi:endoglucanase
VTWTSDVDATAYEISRSEDGGPFRKIVVGNAIDDSGRLVLTYLDRPLSGSILKYQIVTQNVFGRSPAVFAEPVRRSLTQPPTGVTDAVAMTLLNHRVSLTWTRDSTAENYQIRKSVDGGAFAQLAVLPSSQTAYQDAAIGSGQRAYQIISTNRYGASPPVEFERGSVETDLDPNTNDGPVAKP